MTYLLDTNICIYLIKQKPSVLKRFEMFSVGEVLISSITVAELQFGVAKSQAVGRNRAALEQFLLPLIVADFDLPAANAYGPLRALLQRSGTPVSAMDMLIAAHALSPKAILVTNYEREFSRVPNMAQENWTLT